ncbi:MAG: HNH endonuclease [Dermatophilaceae bacterium]|nr:HNH endonuclease [Dermatophilaceae bacterium]NUO92769.1 HNH endonuclease [Dermatophilaceae bacterium]
MCGAHAERVRRGVPLEGEIRGSRTFHDSYQAVESGCWEWTAYVDRNGYGKYRGVWAHRVAYILAGGVIPDGFHIDHLCRNTKCVNPDHLEPVTPRENLLRGNNRAAVVIREGKCIRGHERTPENVYIHPSTGLKRCRTCARERHQARDAA